MTLGKCINNLKNNIGLANISNCSDNRSMDTSFDDNSLSQTTVSKNRS